jgi:hypothetical protein
MAKITPSGFPGEPDEYEAGQIMILRKKRPRSFTVIGNAALQNPDLSWGARGLLAYLYTLPDDWKIHESELLNHTANGRHSTHTALQELIDKGYVNKRQGENIWSDTEFDVDDEPHTPEEWADLIAGFNTDYTNSQVENDQNSSTDYTNSLAENQQSLSRKPAQPLAENQHIQSTQYKEPSKKNPITITKNQNADAPESSSPDFSSPDSSPNFITPDSAPSIPLPDFLPENAPSDQSPSAQSFSGMTGSNAPAVWEIIRKEWNSHNCRFTCDKLYLNLSEAQRERVRGSMATYTPDRMVRAIRKYFKERRENPDSYEYKSFYLFVEKGIEFYV